MSLLARLLSPRFRRLRDRMRFHKYGAARARNALKTQTHLLGVARRRIAELERILGDVKATSAERAGQIEILDRRVEVLEADWSAAAAHIGELERKLAAAQPHIAHYPLTSADKRAARRGGQ